MWADGILFTPVVTEGATSVTGYFPRGIWYSLFSDEVIDATNAGVFVELQTPLTATNAHVRGGKVIAMQEAAMTTSEARQTPFTLLIALDANGSASGDLFLDDGSQVELNKVAELQYTTSNGLFSSTVIQSSYKSEAIIDSLTILSPRHERGSSNASCGARLTIFGDVDRTLTSQRVTKELDSADIVKYDHGVVAKITINLRSSSHVAINVVSGFEVEWNCE